MIVFDNVTKRYPIPGGKKKTILEDASFTLPRDKSLAILGFNGAGKSTMIRMIAGAEPPDAGRIVRDGVKVSWPIGFGGSFHGNLSGRENTKFAARIYGCDVKEVIAHVEAFSELGTHLDMPLRTYSSGMRARLAFGLSMAIDFDIYLVDEVIAVGDARFKAKCEKAFDDRRGIATVIMVSHSPATLRRYCDIGCILRDGQLKLFDDIEEAIAAYEAHLKEAQ